MNNIQKLPFTLYDENEGVLQYDLAELSNILIGGATGQGKTNLMLSILCDLLSSKSSEELKLVLIDPKGCAYTPFAALDKSFFAMSDATANTGVITDSDQAFAVLQELQAIVEARLKVLSESKLKYSEYAALHRDMPYILVSIDEYGDLAIYNKKFLSIIESIAKFSHYVGVYVMMATQRLFRRFFPLGIKAYFPTRIGMRMASCIDSRAVMDSDGAETLKSGQLLLYRTNLSGKLHTKLVTDDMLSEIIKNAK